MYSLVLHVLSLTPLFGLLVVHLAALEAAQTFPSACFLRSWSPILMGFPYLPGHHSLWIVTTLELEEHWQWKPGEVGLWS